MVNPDKIFGRLGNRMFQGAFMYAYAKHNGCDFYFQDPEYFAGCEQEIKALFGADIPPKTNKVAIHVRRGDYVNNEFYTDLSTINYYYEAMREFPDAEFLVFSDDIEWCKKQEIFLGCDFSEGNTEIEDMNLMASCVGHIIANSSFSWWGAYISPYTKKVVYPSRWYADGMTRTKCPSDWIRI